MTKPFYFWLSEEEAAMQALRDGERGAEIRILERLAQLVLSGGTVSPDFQGVVNMLIAKAVISGKLPTQGKGRPEDFLHRTPACPPWSITERYLELTDGGMPYAEAIEQVADEFPNAHGSRMSDRQIERLVREGKPAVECRMGRTVDERQLFRGLKNVSTKAEITTTDAKCVAGILEQMAAVQPVLETHMAIEQSRDYLADLERLIVEALKQGIPDDTK